MRSPVERSLTRLAPAVFAWLVIVASAQAAIEVPYLTGRVTDNAEILSADVRVRIEDLLRAHEQATTNQIAVLTVPTLEGESVEDFATRVFETWKLGQRGKDNGVLVLVVPRDRRMRIAVGYGLEATLPDAAASRVIRDVMTPRFRSGDFGAGVEAGAREIIAQLTGEASSRSAGEPAPVDADKAPDEAHRRGKSGFALDGPDLSLPERILIGGFIFGIIGLFTVMGVVTPGMGWFLYLFLIPFWAAFPMIVVGVKVALVIFAVYLIAFPIAKLIVGRTAWHEKAAAELRKKGTTTIGGFTLTSGSGGSSWSSSASGGGFSGGGGSSGGGGASGSW